MPTPLQLSSDGAFTSSEAAEPEPKLKPFPYPLPMDPAQQTLSSIPLALFYPLILAGIAGVAQLGMLAGRALPVERGQKDLAAYGVAAVLVVAAAGAGVKAKEKRDSAAVVDLYNEIVKLDDCCEITPALVERVGGKYGINMQKDQLDGVKKVYGQFLETLIPTESNHLIGDEGPKVKAFKEALGLSDEDAAPVHIDVGRRLSRDGFESKDRNTQFESRKAFARLIYVSQLVFGEQKAAFLLPWRRTFNLTDSQLYVAKRENAKIVFKAYLESQGGVLSAERHFLHTLRSKQNEVKLADDSTEDVVKEYARRNVEQLLQKAITALKPTGKSVKDLSTVVECVHAIIDYSRKLQRLSNEDDLIPGLGMVTLTGGAFSEDVKGREVKDVFRAYVNERITVAGEVTPDLENEVKELTVILCLGSKEARTVMDDVSAKLYKKLLRDEVVSGR
ncbi:MAG: hypothetical protein WDW38_006843 [Sanguina aurantia]